MQLIYKISPKKFYSDPLLSNLLNAAFKKYKILGEMRGNIKLYLKTKEEAQRLEKFFGSRYSKLIKEGIEIRIEMSIIEEELKKGYNLTLTELHELLYCRPLLTNKEQKQIKERRWENLFTTVEVNLQRDEGIYLNNEEFKNKIYNWFYRVKKGETKKGYIALRDALNKEKDVISELSACMRTLWSILMDWDNLIKKLDINTNKIFIPVLANETTGDAHALDKNRIAGRLFFTVLEYIYEFRIFHENLMDNKNQLDYKFMKRRHIYRHFKIFDDDISSYFHVFSPYLYNSEQKLTKNLSNVEKEVNIQINSNLYVFENPSIFNYLVDELEYYFKENNMMYEMFSDKFPILICTSGQARNAVLQFIANCLESYKKAKVYYAGDFDGAGIQMYRNMAQQFPGNVKGLKMDEETYLRGIYSNNMPLTKEDKAKLNCNSDNFVRFMEKQGVIVFQEGVADILKEELFREIMKVLQN